MGSLNHVNESSIQVALNGLSITIDRHSGGILGLAYPNVGIMLQTDPVHSSLVDLACPIPEFEPMRVATRYSKGVQINAESDCVTIHWEQLGANREYGGIGGSVAAAITLMADTDKRSIILSCHIENRSTTTVRQALFPDFMGLLPFCGEHETVFRTAGLTARPFVELKTPDRDYFFATRLGYSPNFAKYSSGGMQGPDTGMILRWFDYGSLSGGFSLFPRKWGKDTPETVYLHLPEATGTLRLMCEHKITLEPGQTWDSPDYVLTPHTNGWAKGIEPYRDWVRQHYRKLYPLPEHIRDGLGFRSVWMTHAPEPQKPVWRFSDMVKIAEECRKYGLVEIVMWSGYDYDLPGEFHPTPSCGTLEEFKQAVADCENLGVRLTPFVSFILAYGEMAANRYGLKPGTGGNWTYHTDFMPGFAPYYAKGLDASAVDVCSPLWQSDVKNWFLQAMDCGVRSFCWDVFENGWDGGINKPEPNVFTLAGELQAMMRQRDSQAAFSGEDVNCMEVNSAYLDYTWNWRESDASIPAPRVAQIMEVQPLTSVLPTPRMNHNIDRSPLEVKRAFADNLFLNVWPRKPDDINGSDWIDNHPKLGKALLQCSCLRRRFIEYFLEGTFIGECLLTEPAIGLQVRSYILSCNVLTIMLNIGPKQNPKLIFDIVPWVNETCTWQLTVYDENGNVMLSELSWSSKETFDVGPLEHGEMRIMEIVSIGCDGN